MGFLLAFANALTVSFQNSRYKKLAGVHVSVLNAFRLSFTAFMLAIMISVFSEWHVPFDYRFWMIILGITLPTELCSSFLYVKSFQISPQSLVGPFFSLTLVFLIPFGYVILNELPTMLGGGGVLLIFLGAFLLGLNGVYHHVRLSFKNLFQERGVRYMITAAALVSIAITSTKFLFHYTSPLQFAFYINIFLLCVYVPFALHHRNTIRNGRIHHIAMMSVAHTLGTLLHYIGISLIFAVYYISVKRLSLLFDVLFGRVIHKEEHFYERFAGALFMIGGAILIALGDILF